MNKPISIDYERLTPDIGDRHIVSHVSGGAGSAVCAMRCVEWYGKDRVTMVFADTMTESTGAYALLEALEKSAGAPITRLSKGKDIWDTFDEFGMLRIVSGGGACKASVELKQKPLDEFTRQHWKPEDVVVAIGMGWEEPDRQVRLSKRLHPYTAFYPLNVAPKLNPCGIVAELERYGLPKSVAYDAGYSHDNCNGGCVLAGIGQWAGLLKDNPEHFAYCEKRERAFFEKTGFSILRDRRGGDTKSYPLYRLREDIEQGKRIQRDDWRSTCGCMLLFDKHEPEGSDD